MASKYSVRVERQSSRTGQWAESGRVEVRSLVRAWAVARRVEGHERTSGGRHPGVTVEVNGEEQAPRWVPSVGEVGWW